MEAAAECIPTKLKAKLWIPWETAVVKKKSVQTWKPYPYVTKGTRLKHKKAQSELTNVYIREQTKYLEGQINKIRNSIEER